MRSWCLVLGLAVHCAGFNGFSYSRTLTFPTTPPEFGIRHIHSPDHFVPKNFFDMPRYSIASVDPPTHIGNYSTVVIRYRTSRGELETCRMLSSNRCCSHLVLQSGDSPFLITRLTVTPMGVGGHRIDVCAQGFRCMTLWEKIVLPIFMKESVWDRAMREGFANRDENEVMREYRRMALFNGK